MSTFTCTRLSTTCNQKAPMVSQGNIAPDLTLETDRSEKVTLSKLRGRQVVLFLPEGRHTNMEDRVQGQMMKAAAAWARGVHGVDSPAPLCRNVLSWTRPPACSVRRRTRSAPKKVAQVAVQPELVHAVAVRANMRSILVAMMKSFLCSPLIFLVCRETVALPQPKLIFG